MKKLLSIIIVVLFLVGCGNKAVEYDAQNLMSDDDIKTMFTKPNDFKDKSIKLGGKIFTEPEIDGDKVFLQLWNNPTDSSNSFIVEATVDEDLKMDSYVLIEGVVQGEFEGENLYGGKVNSPKIKATKITISDYKTVVAPTIKEVNINQTETQKGLSVTLEKIEFAKEHTRIYLKINNKSKHKVSLFTHNAKLIIDGKQYSEEYIYDADYKKIESEIPSGITEEGVLVVKPIQDINNLKKAKLIVESYSDNYDITMKDFNFNINLEK